MPYWLSIVSVVYIVICVICAFVISVDLINGHKQNMWIMNVVWAVTALYAGPFALWGYFTAGRLSTKDAVSRAQREGKENPGKKKPFWQMTALAATHCGSGCSLGDLIAEWLIFFVPFTLFGKKIFGAWALDLGFAFALGIIFQYFTIKPMRHLSPGDGLKQALKADSASLLSWQVGMYGWMAIATFAIFGHELKINSPQFWFMMQIAMFFGFAASYPVNWWLLKKGIKEKM